MKKRRFKILYPRKEGKRCSILGVSLMIGFDDIYGCYLPTEIDRETDENAGNESNFFELKKKSSSLAANKYAETILEESDEEPLEIAEQLAPLIEPNEGGAPSEATSGIFYDAISGKAPNSSEKEIYFLNFNFEMDFPEIDIIDPESDNLDIAETEAGNNLINAADSTFITEDDDTLITENDKSLIAEDDNTVIAEASSNGQYNLDDIETVSGIEIEVDCLDFSVEIDAECQSQGSPPCSVQLTAPDYSQLLKESINFNSEYLIDESRACDEFCRICNNQSTCSSNLEDWLSCYGCGEAFHRKCLQSRRMRTKCELPIIFRNRISDPEEGLNGIYSHAPWFCNNCVTCSTCPSKSSSCNEIVEGGQLKGETELLKDSFVSCRHCGKVSCLVCYNFEPISNGSIELGKFEKLRNYSCSDCLSCINCGLNTNINGPSQLKNRRRSVSIVSKPSKDQPVLLYDDFTLCRPCYLSNQTCATCPRCHQIYHSLTDHYDFGVAPFNSEFSLCPMVSCDECASWTHCQCEGIDSEEYERLGTSNDAKFICVNCKKSPKKLKRSSRTTDILRAEMIFRRGNLMCPDYEGDDKIMFIFWSFEAAWKRCFYELTFTKNYFVIRSSEIKIEASTLETLTKTFVEKFKCGGTNCLKAVDPRFLLSPMNLLNFLEAAKKHSGFCDYLRREIGKIPAPNHLNSAKTQPIDRVIGAHVRDSVSRRKRLSVSELPTFPKPFSSEIGGGFPTPPTTNTSNGKMTVKFLYMQYLQAIRSDTTIRTVDAISHGLALRPSAISGYGLFSLRTFQKNSLIIEYCGEMLTGEDLVNKRDAFYNLLGKRYQQSCYLFRLDELKVLDATHKGNLSRFINHSCDPNCYSRVVQIDGSKKLLIFASKLIEAGDEILYDYKFPDEEQKIACLCASEKCRKWMN